MISTPPILDDAGPRSRRLHLSVSLAEAIHCPRMSFVLGGSSCLGLMPSTSEEELLHWRTRRQFLVRLGQTVYFNQRHSGNSPLPTRSRCSRPAQGSKDRRLQVIRRLEASRFDFGLLASPPVIVASMSAPFASCSSRVGSASTSGYSEISERWPDCTHKRRGLSASTQDEAPDHDVGAGPDKAAGAEVAQLRSGA